MKNNDFRLKDGDHVRNVQTFLTYLSETKRRLAKYDVVNDAEVSEMYNDIYTVLNKVIGQAVSEADTYKLDNYDMLEAEEYKTKDGKTSTKYFLPREKFDLLVNSGQIKKFISKLGKTSKYSDELLEKSVKEYRDYNTKVEKMVNKTHQSKVAKANIKKTKNQNRIAKAERILTKLETGDADIVISKVFAMEEIRKLVKEAKDLAAERDPNKFRLHMYNKKHAADFAKAHPDLKLSQINESDESVCDSIIDIDEKLGYDDLREQFNINYIKINDTIDYEETPETNTHAMAMLYGKLLRAHESRGFFSRLFHPFRYRAESNMLTSLLSEMIEKGDEEKVLEYVDKGIKTPENVGANKELKESLRDLYEKEIEQAAAVEDKEEIIVAEAEDKNIEPKEIEDENELHRSNLILEGEEPTN